MKNIQHWSALKELHVCYDITTANSSALINGSALFYNEKTDNLKSPTGFGMFKDKVGNLIVVADENTKQSKTLLKGELLGFNSSKELWSNCPIIQVGQTIRNIWGNNNNTRTDRAKLINKGVVSGGYFGNWKFRKPDYNKNFFEVLEKIENNREKHDNPIIIYWSYSEANSLTDVLGYALAIASSFAGPLNIDPKFIEQAGTLIKIWSKGDKTAQNNNIFKSLAMTSEILLPEWTKGATAKWGKIKNDITGKLEDGWIFGKYIDQAKTGYESIQQNFAGNLVTQFSSITGVDKAETIKFLNNIASGKFDQVVDLRKINGSLANANKTFSGVVSSYTNEILKRKMTGRSGGENLLSELSESISVYQVPAINNLFQSGSAGTILQGVIGVDKLIPEIIKREISDNRLTQNNLVGLIASSFGYVGPEDNFDEMTLSALIKQASKYASNKIPFVLPDTIPIGKREKFAIEIKKSVGANVIGYQDNWDYDTNLRKMMPLGIAVAVGGGIWYAKKNKLF